MLWNTLNNLQTGYITSKTGGFDHQKIKARSTNMTLDALVKRYRKLAKTMVIHGSLFHGPLKPRVCQVGLALLGSFLEDIDEILLRP